MPDPQPVIQTIASAAYALIVLLVPLLIRLLYPRLVAWIDAQTQRTRAQMSRDQLWATQQAATMAVSAVEQLRKRGAIVDNPHAYDSAVAFAEGWLRNRGIVLDVQELKAAIESAVRDLPHETLKLTSPMILPGGDKWE
jgi:Bacteriophage holin of superfamily 6 (Holin_LLH)